MARRLRPPHDQPVVSWLLRYDRPRMMPNWPLDPELAIVCAMSARKDGDNASEYSTGWLIESLEELVEYARPMDGRLQPHLFFEVPRSVIEPHLAE